MENRYEDPCGTSELWKHVLPLAKTPWTMEYQWSFNNLQNALEEGGPLNAGNVYLFSFPEPTFILKDDKESYTCIPIITAVSSSCPPSQKIGILYPFSSPRDDEIVDMRSCNLEWVPYTSPRFASSKAKPHIFILSRLEGKSGNINRVEESGSYVPYFDFAIDIDICPKEASQGRRIMFYKFYPDATNYSPDVPVKTKFINRFYGVAHEVV